MAYQEDNKLYIGDVTYLGHIARSAQTPKVRFINEFPDVNWILNPNQIFFTSEDAQYDGGEDYYFITLPDAGFPSSSRLFTNAEPEGDGIRELIRKTDISAAANIWHYQEILDSDGILRKIATKPGKAFQLGVNYLLTYHETEEP